MSSPPEPHDPTAFRSRVLSSPPLSVFQTYPPVRILPAPLVFACARPARCFTANQTTSLASFMICMRTFAGPRSPHS